MILIHNVIDNDHWRHLFLLYGIIWGVVAAEKMAASKARRAAVAYCRADRPARGGAAGTGRLSGDPPRADAGASAELA